jgi:hypothetical protein
MQKYNKMPVVIAIIIHFFLIFINVYFIKKSNVEKFTISDADSLSSIIFKDNAASSIITDVKALELKEDNLVFILQSEMSDEAKLNKLKGYICDLVTKRNENSAYKIITPNNKITCKDFIKVLNLVSTANSEYNIDYNNKISEFNGLMINDLPYMSVINMSVDNKVKFMGPTTPNIISLTNDILNQTLPK